MNRRYRAFTLIEVMIAIGIITLLASILVISVGAMSASSKKSATRLLLQNATGMLDEYGRSTANPLTREVMIPSQPVADIFARPGATPPSLVEVQFNGSRDTDANWRAMPMALTRSMMYRLSQTPNVRKMMQGLSEGEQLYRWNDGVGEYMAPPSSGNVHVGMKSFVDVTEVDPITGDSRTRRYFYLASTNHTVTARTAPRTGDASAGYWLQVTGRGFDTTDTVVQPEVPVMLDAWYTPVLFMPSGGFVAGTRWVTSAGTFGAPGGDPRWVPGRLYSPNDPATRHVIAQAGANSPIWRVYRCIAPVTSTTSPVSDSQNWVMVPTQAFFASAGPDGIFYNSADLTTMDDNIYSFER